MREVATRFWLFTFAGMIVFGVVYYRHAQNELSVRRERLAARQRAVVLATGKAGFVLRDEIERWVQSFATLEIVNRVSPSASLDAIAHGPGIYLRLAQSEALEVSRLRKAAASSVHDGFTSCLFVGRANALTAGTACKAKTQCGIGELCDDWGVCSVPNQPYNLRLLYDALKVLGPEWGERLSQTGDELEVRALELELDDTSQHEIPAAAELVRRSKFFSVVLDEPPSAKERSADPDAGAPAPESPEQRLQARDHYVRVGIWDLERKEPLVQMRFEAAGRFLTLGQRATAPEETAHSRQRQANNCAAALEVRDALGANPGATLTVSDSAEAGLTNPAQPSPTSAP
jgi:hypothetical protein